MGDSPPRRRQAGDVWEGEPRSGGRPKLHGPGAGGAAESFTAEYCITAYTTQFGRLGVGNQSRQCCVPATAGQRQAHRPHS